MYTTVRCDVQLSNVYLHTKIQDGQATVYFWWFVEVLLSMETVVYTVSLLKLKPVLWIKDGSWDSGCWHFKNCSLLQNIGRVHTWILFWKAESNFGTTPAMFKDSIFAQRQLRETGFLGSITDVYWNYKQCASLLKDDLKTTTNYVNFSLKMN